MQSRCAGAQMRATRFAPFRAIAPVRPIAPLRASFKDTAPALVKERGEFTQFPDEPGVYAVYDNNGNLQFIGLTRKLAGSISTHMQELPDLTFAVKVDVVPSGTREELTAQWKAWIEEAMEENGEAVHLAIRSVLMAAAVAAMPGPTLACQGQLRLHASAGGGGSGAPHVPALQR